MNRSLLWPALAAAALTGLVGTACKDYLDITPASSYITEDVFSSVTNANSAVIGAYAPL